MSADPRRARPPPVVEPLGVRGPPYTPRRGDTGHHRRGGGDPPARLPVEPTERPAVLAGRDHGAAAMVYQCTPLRTLASMTCSDSRVPADPSPLAAAESGNT